jgi:uncharacterized phage protein (TIGR01671 family)
MNVMINTLKMGERMWESDSQIGGLWSFNVFNGNPELKKGWELMQFTGLIDRNGKEIYEGDIVTGAFYDNENEDEYLSNNNNIVSFSNGSFYPFHKINGWRSGVECLEVIGNIHENPELIEQKETPK